MADDPKPAMGDVLGPAGEPVSISANGKVWKLGYPTPAAIDRLEKFVAAQAVAELAALEDALPADEFARQRAELRGEITARAHRAGGELWGRVLSSPSGQVLYLLALFRHHHPDMTAEDVLAVRAAAPLECDVALELVSPFFFALVAVRLGKTPEQAGAEAVAFRARVAARKAAGSST